MNKPNGMTLITPEMAEDFLEALPVGKFHGVGRVTKEKMNLLGIEKGADLKKWQEVDLIKHFGKAGSHYYHIVRGIDERSVQNDHVRKSFGAERTFSTDYNDWTLLKTELEGIANKVSERMEKKSVKGKTISLKLRYDNFETITRALTLSFYTSTKEVLLEQSVQLMEQTQAGDRKVRLLGISVSNLDSEKKEESGIQLKFDFMKRESVER